MDTPADHQPLGPELPEPDVSAITSDYMQRRLADSKAYTMVLLRSTAKVAEPGAREILWQHGRRNMALQAEGTLPIVLRVADDSGWAGFGVFAAPPETVARIMDADPGVEAGIFTYELHPVQGFPGSTLP